MKIQQTDACKKIITQLQQHGYKAYMVGGCVRDGLLNIPSHDEDIATSALPAQVKGLFHTYDTGLKHGTVTTILNDTPYEITTFRTDGDYSDGRHPDTVAFVDDIVEDLSRRDFTINAMAYNDSEGIIDPFDGQKDLTAKVIRCVGDANTRFQEDALRMMRAIRFSAKLGFTIDPDTQTAIQDNAHLIKNVSKERIQSEMEKILLSDHPEYFELLHQYGLLQYISQDLNEMFLCAQNNPYHYGTVGKHAMDVLKHLSGQSKELLWAGLFHDIGKPRTKTTIDGVDHFYGHPVVSTKIADQCMQDLRFDNKTKNYILRLVANHDKLPHIGTSKHPHKQVRNFLLQNQDMPDGYFYDFCVLKEADSIAHTQPEKLLKHCEVAKQILEPYYNGTLPRTRSALAVNGNDLLQQDVPPEQIGKVLNDLLRHVIDHPDENTRERLVQITLGIAKQVQKTVRVQEPQKEENPAMER